VRCGRVRGVEGYGDGLAKDNRGTGFRGSGWRGAEAFANSQNAFFQRRQGVFPAVGTLVSIKKPCLKKKLPVSESETGSGRVLETLWRVP
jgi:hypothetical protein